MTFRKKFWSALPIAWLGLAGCDGADVPALDTVPQPAEPQPLSPDAQRAAAIRASLDRVKAECQRNAGGDWELWQQKTAPFRDGIRASRSAAVLIAPQPNSQYMEARGKMLPPIDDFPLFECAADCYMWHLLEPERVTQTKAVESVIAAHRWLHARGINLILVVAPKMLEVYPEHFAANCPADCLVNPPIRRAVHDMLAAGVEVVDLQPVMLAERYKAAELLYLAADPHWGPRGYELGALSTAERLKRYPFIVAALTGPPAVKSSVEPFWPFASGLPLVSVARPALTPAQQEKALAAHPKSMTCVRAFDGNWAHSASSPVMVIGNSYVSGFEEVLCKEINMPIHFHAHGGQTTEAFTDLLREPELLANTKVVVWVTNTAHLAEFKPMPKPILATVK